MKLDFQKAFDRVDHEFLWATLSAMNLDPGMIVLIQGLITNVEAKVHVNGLFTCAFPLEHGVCQGDPMSLLLFALSSQPLMSQLEGKWAHGLLSGLRIFDHKSLLFQLFIDDVGLFL